VELHDERHHGTAYFVRGFRRSCRRPFRVCQLHREILPVVAALHHDGVRGRAGGAQNVQEAAHLVNHFAVALYLSGGERIRLNFRCTIS
jgi:hypothetical protein